MTGDVNHVEKKLKSLISAIKETYKDFTLDTDFSKRNLTVFELVILNNIAISLNQSGKIKEAIQLLLDLEEYFRTHNIEREEFAKQYPVVLDNLVSWLCSIEDFKKAEYFAQKGIDCCVKYGKLSPLPFMTFNLGYIKVVLNKTEEGKKHIEQALSLLALMNKTEDVKVLKKDIIDSFGSEFMKRLASL